MRKYARPWFVVALAASLLLAAFMFAPVSTESLLNGPIHDPSAFQCPRGVQAVVAFSEEADAKVYLSNNGKFIVVEFAGDQIAQITFGTYKLDGGKLVVLTKETLPVKDAVARFPNPCSFFSPDEA